MILFLCCVSILIGFIVSCLNTIDVLEYEICSMKTESDFLLTHVHEHVYICVHLNSVIFLHLTENTQHSFSTCCCTRLESSNPTQAMVMWVSCLPCCLCGSMSISVRNQIIYLIILEENIYRHFACCSIPFSVCIYT